MYNRYIQRYQNNKGLRTNSQPEPRIDAPPPSAVPADFERGAEFRPPVSREAPRKAAREGPLPVPPYLAGLKDGLKDMLQGVLGDKFDIGDLLLILILLLLYLEKEDEEILITLSALVFIGLNGK